MPHIYTNAMANHLGPLFALFLLMAPPCRSEAALRTLDRAQYHLRSGDEPEWAEFIGKIPRGRRLDLSFTGASNRTESTLLIRQSDVKLDWPVELNGKRLGKLFLLEQPLVWSLRIPPAGLREGSNTLSILPPKENDDILVSDFKLDERALEQTFDATLEVRVTDRTSHAASPCRITVTDDQGALAPLYPSAGQTLAARPGVVYTPDGVARLRVPPGRYTVYASRGFEYGVSRRRVSVASGKTRQVGLQIEHEVPTEGLVSCDTHIHTFTHARHGDATLDERMLTLAGEGLELPISTEHNVLIDFAEAAVRMGVAARFTPVLGCEVTTSAAHFNVFPIQPGASPPDAREQSWPKLMASLRSLPGAQLIVLNHPRDEHNYFIPFAATNFNAVTGQPRSDLEFSFNAVELINSGALRSDWRQVYGDWFALLNSGLRVTGVAGSDSHDVSRFIVGQGRTYIRCHDSDPGRLDIAEACRSLREGRALVSLGLLTDLTVDGKFHVGDLATGLGKTLLVTVEVLGPAWTQVDRVELFANGIRIQNERIQARGRGGEKARVRWELERPAHDAHLVALASGPGVTSPHWAIPRPYQPSSLVWEPRVLGSTNPIWVDGDGDGHFTPARAYAQSILQQTGPDPAKLFPALAGYDEAVAAQAAGLVQALGKEVRSQEYARYLNEAPAAVQRGFRAFAATAR